MFKTHNTIYLLLLSFLFCSCYEIEEIEKQQYSIKGRIVNVNNLEKFDGFRLRLVTKKYNPYNLAKADVLAECVITDSGKFNLIYSATSESVLLLKCVDDRKFSATIKPNVNLKPVFFIHQIEGAVAQIREGHPADLR